MQYIERYSPPSVADLARLKCEMNLTSNQLAALADLSTGGNWRRYTGGPDPRPLGLKMHFMMAALMTLSDSELARVLDIMRSHGAQIESSALPGWVNSD